MGYRLDPVSGATASSGWTSADNHLIPLDATHTLFWGWTTGQGTKPIRAVVIEHSTPTAPTVGTSLIVFDTTASISGFSSWAFLSPDGTTIIFAIARSGGFSGHVSQAVTWNSAMGLSLSGSLTTDTSTTFSPQLYAGWPIVVMPTSSRVFLADGGGAWQYRQASSTGIGTLISSGSGIGSTIDGWRISSTQIVLRDSTGPALKLVDVTGDTVTFPASVTLPSTIKGMRQESSRANYFRCYDYDATAHNSIAVEYHVASSAFVTDSTVTLTPSANPTLAAWTGNPARWDVDGLTSLGVDSSSQVVVTFSADVPARVADYAAGVIYTDPTDSATTGTAWSGNADVPLARNIADGKILVCSGTGVAVYQVVNTTPAAGWTVGAITMSA